MNGKEEELELEAVALSTSRKNSYLWKLAKHTKMKHTTKATLVGMLGEQAKMEYATRAGTTDSRDGEGFAGSAGGLNPGHQRFCQQRLNINRTPLPPGPWRSKSNGMGADHCPTMQTTIALASPRSDCS